MLTPITNNRITPAYSTINPSFKGNMQAGMRTAANTGKKLSNNRGKFLAIPLLFASAIRFVAKLYGREAEFSDSGKLLRTNKYKNGQLVEVTHYSKKLRRPSAIDEYVDGKLSKTTHFYEGEKNPDWEILYRENGDNVLSEFYPNGNVKSRQFDIADVKNEVVHYDMIKKGVVIRREKYNPDETLAYAISYEPNRDMEIFEAYKNGVLDYKEATFSSKDLKRKIFYDKNEEVVSIKEEGKGYTTDYTYLKGRKHSSVTRYNEGNTSRLEVIYNTNGTSALELYYNRENKLYERKEFPDENTRITTRYNDKGKVILSEKVDLRTNKFTRKLGKNSK